MKEIIKGKCAECGLVLEIDASLEDFECSFCGTPLSAKSSEESVSAEPPRNAQYDVPGVVANKLATDTAIEKLKGELQQIDESIAATKRKAWLDQKRNNTLFLTCWICLSIGCLVLLAATQQIYLFLLIWAVLTGVILYFYKKYANEIEINYTIAYDSQVYQAQEIEKRIQKQRKEKR